MYKKTSDLEAWFKKVAKALSPVFLLALLIPAAGLISTTLRAQSFYGSIVGTVTDSSGAVVPDATVTATDIGTNQSAKVQTDANGKFSLVNLVPSDYKIEVSKANFKRFVREHVPVQVGQTIRIDSALAVGNVSETVQVSTAAPLLQTDSSTLGQEVEGATVQQMPLNGRNVMNLIALAPGVVPTGGAMGDTGLNQGTRTGGGTGWGNYEIGGSIQGQSAQYLDGVPNNLLGGNQVALVPTQDAVQEFNVASSNAGADFGRFSGGVVNMTTKTGSNSFHGGAWEYLRNRDFNANDFFSNQTGNPRVQWNQNQYGAAINGPIKKDKAFFMFTWEAFKATTGSVSTTNVPTAALQQGIIPRYITDPINCPNPSNTATCKSLTFYSDAGATNQVTPNATGSNVVASLINPSYIDPLSKVLKNYYPSSNVNGNGYNWYFAGPLGNNQNQYNARVDYALGSKDRLFGRYTYWALHDWPAHSEFGQKGQGSTHWATDDGHVIDLTHQAVVGNTYTFNPSTVLDVRLNYVRVTSPNYPGTISQDETVFDQYQTTFKPYAALGPQMSVHSLPGIAIGANGNSSNYSFYNLGNFPGYSVNWYNTYGINANLIKIVGAHSIKIGAELRLMDGSGSGFDNTESGQYAYSSSSFGIGDDWAAFLLGYPTQVQFQTINNTAPYTYYQGYYVSDTWTASHNLTVNLGLRYELPGAISERNNKAYVLLPNVNDPVQTAIKGTLQLVNSSLYNHRSTVIPEKNLFAPHVGFAYRAGANTVIRGGYGISYLPSDLEGGLLSYNQSINAAQTKIQQNTNISNPLQLQTILQNIVATGLQKPTGNSVKDIIGYQRRASTTGFLNQGIGGPVPNQPYPYTQQWNAAVSHQFKGDAMVELSYSGLKGTNIPGIGNNGWNLNQIPDSFDSLGAALGATPAPGTCAAQDASTAKNYTVGQCDRPFPYYGNVSDSAQFNSRENYHSFQATGEKRLGAAGVINANYTWAQNRGNTDTQANYIESKSQQQGGNGSGGIQDYNKPGAEYSLISYDVTNRANVSYVVNLPFGKGQKFGNSLNGAANEIVSGWAVNGITTFQSGFPVFFSTSNGGQLGNYGAGSLRPNRVAGCNPVIGGSGLARANAGGWFNTSCFTYPGDYAFGNEPRVDPQVRGDGVKNFDFSFQKSTTIHESANFEFRAEFFNIFNRVQFAPPNGSQGNGNFGKVTYQVNKPRQIQLSARINF
jgi:hypothetical protein